MNNKNRKVKYLVVAIVLITCVACHKTKINGPVVGHWGCEQYVSCRNSFGFENWETIPYEVGAGKGIEVFFNEDGKGELYLNDSPAIITKFDCKYSYDEVHNQVIIKAPFWLFLASQAFISLDENRAVFNIEQLDDTALVASWTNKISETEDFFERFYLKKID